MRDLARRVRRLTDPHRPGSPELDADVEAAIAELVTLLGDEAAAVVVGEVLAEVEQTIPPWRRRSRR